MTVARRSERKSVNLLARCLTPSGMVDAVVISNLTAEGCCISGRALSLKPGQHVVIRPQALQGLAGIVRWALGHEAGIQFQDPLYAPVAQHLQRTHSITVPDRSWRASGLSRAEP